MSERFYAMLPSFSDFSQVTDSQVYHAIPGGWDLIITDVVDSTKAIQAGRYKNVNAAGVSSIVALRNAVPDIEIPYIFGGDGATVLTPGSQRNAIEAALRGIRRAARAVLDLKMRVALMPVKQLLHRGAQLRVARYQVSPELCFAMFSGDGFDLAEELIKAPVEGKRYQVEGEGADDCSFDGFECRWRPIPARNGLAVSLIVRAMAPDESARELAYRHVLEEIAALTQATSDGCPVSKENMRLAPKWSLQTEKDLVSFGKDDKGRRQAHKRVEKGSRNARFLFATGISAGGFSPKQYLSELVANTDFRKFDNVLRMHLDLRRGQLDRLKLVLQQAEDQGHILYGIHTADHTLMTCAIDTYQGKHAHFVDGAAGGYALAAQRIKARLREGSESS